MKQLLCLSVIMMSILICGTALAADDIAGEYISKSGTITIKKATDAHLVRATFKNGHTVSM